MTAEPEARPAPPTHGEAAPHVPTIRAVARVTPIVPKVRATASVPGAIDPAHRGVAHFVPPVPRKPFHDERFHVEADGPEAIPKEPEKPEVPSDLGESDRPAEVDIPALLGPVERPERSVGKAAVGKASLLAPPAPEVIVSPAEPMPVALQVETAKKAGTVEAEPKRRQGWRQRALLPVVVGIAAAFTAGTGYLSISQPALDPDIGRWGGTHASVPPPDSAPFAVPEASATADPFGAQSPELTGVPTRLKVKAIGLNTSLEALRLGDNGELIPPKNFAKAGWYAEGTRPGDVGPAVIAGHVDSRRGPAVFYKLRELEAGDRIEVTRGGKTVRFRVVSTAWYPKTSFPTIEVYGPTPDRQLRLITCGGVFDHSLRSYKDNLVVYAVAG